MSATHRLLTLPGKTLRRARRTRTREKAAPNQENSNTQASSWSDEPSKSARRGVAGDKVSRVNTNGSRPEQTADAVYKSSDAGSLSENDLSATSNSSKTGGGAELEWELKLCDVRLILGGEVDDS